MVRTTPMTTLICESCSQEYVRSAGSLRAYEKANGQPRKYCSRVCYGAAKRIHPLVLDRACRRCAVIIQPRPSFDTKGRRKGTYVPKKYCSLSCSTADRNEIGATGWLDKNGYRLVSRDGVTIPEHREVMEAMIGRPLRENENVHHKNGDRALNDPSNLELWHVSQPIGQRVSDKMDWCIQFMKDYADELAARGYTLATSNSKNSSDYLDIGGFTVTSLPVPPKYSDWNGDGQRLN